MGTKVEMVERDPRLGGGRRVHELEEFFLQEPCPCEVFGVGEHDLDSSPVVRAQPIGPRQQQFSAALEVFAFIGRQGLLNAPAYVFEGPNAVPNHVKPVDDDLGRRKEGTGDVPVSLVHIHDEMRDILPVRERFQVVLDGRRRAVGQDIQDLALLGRGKDGLESLAACVPLELSMAMTEGNFSGLALDSRPSQRPTLDGDTPSSRDTDFPLSRCLSRSDSYSARRPVIH